MYVDPVAVKRVTELAIPALALKFCVGTFSAAAEPVLAPDSVWKSYSYRL